MAFGVWHAGGTVVPLMHIATDLEIQNIIKAANLNCLFISPKLNKDSDFEVPEVLSMDFKTSQNQKRSTLGNLMRDAPYDLPAQLKHGTRTHHDDMAVLIFTSGTTGNPKGVVLSHRNIVSNIIATYDLVPSVEGGRAVSVLPLSHMFELIAGFTIAHIKGICVSYPNSLKPEDVLGEMKLHRATMLASVPLFFEVIDRAIQEKLNSLPMIIRGILNLWQPLVRKFPWLGKFIFRKVHNIFGGHIKFFVTGGAKIDSEIVRRFYSLGLPVLQGYGLTETSPILTLTTLGDHNYASVGKAISSIKIKIENPNANGEGEICVSGASVFSGYHENQAATLGVLKEGWFHTGDVGFVDEEGYLYITGRAKDIIVTANGKNVYPEELEDILRPSTLFSEITVLGLNSGRGEVVHAVVVPSSLTPQDPLEQREAVIQEIDRRCLALSDYKRVQSVSISYEELPKTPTKKVRKHLLREMVVQGKFDKGAQTKSRGSRTLLDKNIENESWLYKKISLITKKTDLFKEADLRHDLGIDSLTFIELISALETSYGVRVPDEDFDKIHTVSDLLSRLEKAHQDMPVENKPEEVKNKKVFNYKNNNGFLMNTTRLWVHVFFIRPFLKIYFRFQVLGYETFKDVNNFIMTPNHSSHLDLLCVLSALPLSKLNQTYAVAADDYFFNHWFKSFIVRLVFNAIPFERKARVEKGFKVCEEILQNGGSLVIFPEGTRSISGKMVSFKPGVGRLLANQKFNAIPIYIKGAFDAFPKGASMPRPRKVSLYIGSPRHFIDEKIDLSGYQSVGLKLQGDVETLRDQLS